ncbi:transmembrane protein 179B-like isoform X1 [Argopecten irradians]|uniref:transmembrane protein 179B-like isoform X1 n=1 Tax=Argopecten irradians TaxID=31199 RepID=UPI003721DDAE
MLDLHLLAQTVVYCCTFICGFVVAIPIGVTNTKFDGSCILYGDFTWKTANEFLMQSSEQLNCNFSIYLNVLGGIFYSLFLLAYNSYAVHRSRSDHNVVFGMWVLPFILLNSVMTVMILVSSCIITVGFNNFCSGITETNHYQTCADAQDRDWINHDTGDNINVGNFYELITVAKVTVPYRTVIITSPELSDRFCLASWISFLLWLGQVALGILRFVRNRTHRKRTADRERIGDVDPSS